MNNLKKDIQEKLFNLLKMIQTIDRYFSNDQVSS